MQNGGLGAQLSIGEGDEVKSQEPLLFQVPFVQGQHNHRLDEFLEVRSSNRPSFGYTIAKKHWLRKNDSQWRQWVLVS